MYDTDAHGDQSLEIRVVWFGLGAASPRSRPVGPSVTEEWLGEACEAPAADLHPIHTICLSSRLCVSLNSSTTL